MDSYNGPAAGVFLAGQRSGWELTRLREETAYSCGMTHPARYTCARKVQPWCEDRFPGFGRAKSGYRHCARALTRGGWAVHLRGVDQPRQTADRGGRQAGEERVWVARICVDAGHASRRFRRGRIRGRDPSGAPSAGNGYDLDGASSNMTPLSCFALRRRWRFGVFWSRCACTETIGPTRNKCYRT